ncbi:uncharacterized protein LOC126907676 isoform X2 [Daktulosphaira vitifoliae]|uniref:uncharacterized protein LOC126907676 isoform X2 n=1 Tax=Daktulosphaira vitifoliae TaxID=58002 RepID=UPI0021AAD6D2|nr:uncharacterized protein LOC126907676 isoform X2 [Daktulosphaira vitifoliae]
MKGFSLIEELYYYFNRYDLDQSTFSPPAGDDSFFLVRYMKQDAINENTNESLMNKSKSVGENLSEINVKPINKIPPTLIVTEPPEYKGHPLACQRFITNACGDAVAAASLGDKVADPPKSLGVDDGFKTGASECGKSIVAMAHQMVSGRRLYKGRASAGPQDILVSGPPPSTLSKRRNSKSLPASPMCTPPGSPRSVRKNPFFTAPFQEESGEKYGSSWLLSNLFSHRVDSQEELTEKEQKKLPKPSSSNNLYVKPKPSELREMNFWSPTSM